MTGTVKKSGINIRLLAAGAAAAALLTFIDILLGGRVIGASEAAEAIFHPSEADPAILTIVTAIRLPRAVNSLLAGCLLSLSGALMQAIFRNPLADPHILGVSSGAGLGAAIATLTVFTSASSSPIGLSAAAFAGAAFSAALILASSAKIRSSSTFLIFGVMLGFIFSAVTSILEYSANEESLKLYYSWAAGTFPNSWSGSALMACALGIGAILAAADRKGLDMILFGEEYASLSGARTGRIRFLAILSCCVMTGCATAFCGPIGFVGIISPHIARMLSGTSRHSVVLPLGTLIGACVTLTADIISQSVRTPVPPGSTAALIGIPVVIYILLKSK